MTLSSHPPPHFNTSRTGTHLTIYDMVVWHPAFDPASSLVRRMLSLPLFRKRFLIYGLSGGMELRSGRSPGPDPFMATLRAIPCHPDTKAHRVCHLGNPEACKHTPANMLVHPSQCSKGHLDYQLVHYTFRRAPGSPHTGWL